MCLYPTHRSVFVLCVSFPVTYRTVFFLRVSSLLLKEQCSFSVFPATYRTMFFLRVSSPLLIELCFSVCLSRYLKNNVFFLCLPCCLKNGGFSLWLFPAAYRTVSFSVSSSQCCTANVYLSTRQCTHRPSPYKGSWLPVPSANQNITINIPREKAEATFFSQANPAQHRNESLVHSERKLETK